MAIEISFPSGTESVSEFLAVVRENLGYFKGGFLDQSGKEATSVLITFIHQGLKIHPTSGSVKSHERVLLVCLVWHLRKVFHINVNERSTKKRTQPNLVKSLNVLGAQGESRTPMS